MSGQDVMAAAAEVEAFCRSRGWRFCFIGGIAVQRWGTPRFTQDVDATVLAGFGQEEMFVDAILANFPARRPDARRLALDHRVLLVRTAAGVPVDFSLGAMEFEEHSIRRASLWQANQAIAITTCSAEDLLVHKAFAGRDRDWSDVESVLARQKGKLNLDQVRRDLVPLLELKEDPQPLEKLERLIVKVQSR